VKISIEEDDELLNVHLKWRRKCKISHWSWGENV